MLDLAHARVQKLQDQGHPEANVYGEDELDGLRVISVLQESPEKYGLPVDPQISWSLRLWRAVPITPAVIIAGGLILGANYLYNRRVQGKLKQAKQSKQQAK